MNDFRITLPRNPLMTAQRDDVPRRGEAVAAPRGERTSFDATLQRASSRETTAARASEGNGARDASPTPARPPAASSMPPAPAARAMKSDDNDRPTPPADDDGNDAPTDAAIDGRALATAVSAAVDDGPMQPADEPAQAEDLANGSTLPLASEASVTAGLIAASMAIGSAAARASTALPVAEDSPETDEPALPGSDLVDASGKPAAGGGGKAGRADVDAAKPGALPELSADLTRTPARDRLMQDFEQRFENSLARAVGAPSGTAGGASTLLLAGLPPQPLPAQSAVPIAHASIATPLSHPAFSDDLAHRVLLFAGQRLQSAEISVTPADLGPIRVSLELRGQEASVQFNAAHAATRSAIEDALPRLRELLAAQGLQLAQADVGDRAPRDPQGGRGGEPSRPQTGLADARAAALGAAVDASAAGTVSGRRVGLIDVRV